MNIAINEKISSNAVDSQYKQGYFDVIGLINNKSRSVDFSGKVWGNVNIYSTFISAVFDTQKLSSIAAIIPQINQIREMTGYLKSDITPTSAETYFKGTGFIRCKEISNQNIIWEYSGPIDELMNVSVSKNTGKLTNNNAYVIQSNGKIATKFGTYDNFNNFTKNKASFKISSILKSRKNIKNSKKLLQSLKNQRNSMRLTTLKKITNKYYRYLFNSLK